MIQPFGKCAWKPVVGLSSGKRLPILAVCTVLWAITTAHVVGFTTTKSEVIAVLLGSFLFYGLTIVLALTLTVLRLEERLIREQEEVQVGKMEVVNRLALAAEYRDDATGGHNYRMSRYAQILAEELGLSCEEATLIFHASALHDVGKIGIPDSILLKPGPLSAQEREIVQSHVEIGARLLGDATSTVLQLAQTIALTHHESWDGSGYPNGLSQLDIPLEGRIVAVCDVFDALRSPRPYKDAWPIEEVVDEIQSLSGIKFDPWIVEAFIRALPRLLQVSNEQVDVTADDRSSEVAVPALTVLSPQVDGRGLLAS